MVGISRAGISDNKKKWRSLKMNIIFNYQLYLIILIPWFGCLFSVIFQCMVYRLLFATFRPLRGLQGSEWVGLEHFNKFFNHYMFKKVVKNTIALSIYQLLAGFPFPILLALALNNTLFMRFKKTVQIVTYMPHFISTVVMVGIIRQFLSPKTGLINHLIALLGKYPG